MADEPVIDNIPHIVQTDGQISVRSVTKREIDVRLLPWGTTIETIDGLEEFQRGALADAAPDSLLLMGLEHEAHMGLGQNGQPKLTRRPQGRSKAVWEADDGPYATFGVARTQAGDELLALAEDRIVTGVSVEFMQVPGGTVVQTRGGRRVRVHQRVRATGASLTYQPAYEQAAVVAVRSEDEGEPEVSETAAVVETPAPADNTTAIVTGIGDRLDAAVEKINTRAASDEVIGKYLERLEAMEERSRASFQIPSGEKKSHPDDFTRGDWLKTVLRSLSGETQSQAELQARVAADLITADNLGVVPEAFLSEIVGIIDPARPFLQSTRKLTTPRSGMQLTVPVITTRPTVGVQAAEKDELVSTATSITSTSFNPDTVGGYGDISLQLLKRSDPSYLEMYVDLLSEAYAIMADDLAVQALLDAAGVHDGGTIVPDDGPQFGDAWANGTAVSRRLTPDTIWMSSQAVAAFIDAKSDTTNAPLYANLAGAFTAAGGPGGTISGLRPVHVPALDDESRDIIVGPSRGFAWAEDGSFILQVDVPAKAGRDVGLVGMLWFAPLYPAAFTAYDLTGS
jgi:phage head maturation protease